MSSKQPAAKVIPDHAELGQERIVFFSDAVMAIVIWWLSPLISIATLRISARRQMKSTMRRRP